MKKDFPIFLYENNSKKNKGFMKKEDFIIVKKFQYIFC